MTLGSRYVRALGLCGLICATAITGILCWFALAPPAASSSSADSGTANDHDSVSHWVGRWVLPRPRVDEPALVERRLLESVRYLASDELEGRGVGTLGLDLAAEYIAKEFRDLRLNTEMVNGTPFQIVSRGRARPSGAEGELERIQGGTDLLASSRDLKNVLAALHGESDDTRETVVVGAHYDHLGYGGGWGSLAPWTNEVHNGADDNASGTAVMLEVARQLAARDEKLRRRVLFIAFTAEESGLIGSEFFVRHPLASQDDYIAMINLDMVGYLRQQRLEISGTGTAREFESLVMELGSQHSLRITVDPSGYGPSDHASFHARGVPVLHMFTGFHENYHRPSDDAEHVNYAGMRQITQLTVDLVVRLANAERRPTPTSARREVGVIAARGNTSRQRPLGIQGDGSFAGPGVLVSKVTSRSPAERAGIRAGDVILKVNQSDVGNHQELEQATLGLGNQNAARLHIQRSKFQMEFEVRLHP